MNENLQSKGSKALNLILSIVCFIVALFHIFIAWDTSISLVQQRVFHVFAMVLIYFLMQTQQAAQVGRSQSSSTARSPWPPLWLAATS